MILSDLEGHAPTASLAKLITSLFCSRHSFIHTITGLHNRYKDPQI